MVRRFLDTTSPTKGGLSPNRSIVSNPRDDFAADWTNPAPRRKVPLHHPARRGWWREWHRAPFAHGDKVFSSRQDPMADHVVPHFHNDAGVATIEIGSREFMCVGANPPFDHPHVFLDLGGDSEIICPYCSTLYRYAADLRPGEARPPECVVKDKAA
jgi:uncharacterized Zn-finger protein